MFRGFDGKITLLVIPITSGYIHWEDSLQFSIRHRGHKLLLLNLTRNISKSKRQRHVTLSFLKIDKQHRDPSPSRQGRRKGGVGGIGRPPPLFWGQISYISYIRC